MNRFGIIMAAALLVSAGAARADDRRGYSKDGQYLYAIDAPRDRHDRLSRHKGYFDHGYSDGSGTFDYDRGYPYDHFPGSAGFVEEPPQPREIRCRTQMVDDRAQRRQVPVRICGG